MWQQMWQKRMGTKTHLLFTLLWAVNSVFLIVNWDPSEIALWFMLFWVGVWGALVLPWYIMQAIGHSLLWLAKWLNGGKPVD